MKIIAIIPARLGSKRIPKKNITDFKGLPMIAWTIKAALDSGIFHKVVVSTDSDEIAKTSIEYGAEVPFLRLVANDDISPVSDATHASLLQAEEYWNIKYSTVVQLMANCPFRTSEDIINFVDEFKNKKLSFLISRFKFRYMNPWCAFKINNTNHKWIHNDDIVFKRSQDQEPLYCPTGAIWIANRDSFIKQKTFYGSGYKFKEINFQSAIDIDSMSDLDFASSLSFKK